MPPTVTATLDPAQPNGASGWWTSNVVATITATDNGTVSSRQYSVDGGQTWTNVPNNGRVTISAEGTTTLLYRATDNGGNVSAVGSSTIKIDKSDPVVSFAGVTAGQSVANTADVTWTTTDAVSGMASVAVTVDGATVPSGQPLELWRLSLGSHTVVVTATDVAGRSSSSTVTFTTTTSLPTLTTLVGQLADDGLVSNAGESRLAKRLGQASKQLAAGRRTPAIAQLREFITLASDPVNVPDAAARAALVRDAQAVIDQLA